MLNIRKEQKEIIYRPRQEKLNTKYWKQQQASEN